MIPKARVFIFLGHSVNCSLVTFASKSLAKDSYDRDSITRDGRGGRAYSDDQSGAGLAQKAIPVAPGGKAFGNSAD